jgi:hypothetical protein
MSVSAGGVSVGSPVSSELDAELAACFSGGETSFGELLCSALASVPPRRLNGIWSSARRPRLPLLMLGKGRLLPSVIFATLPAPGRSQPRREKRQQPMQPSCGLMPRKCSAKRRKGRPQTSGVPKSSRPRTPPSSRRRQRSSRGSVLRKGADGTLTLNCVYFGISWRRSRRSESCPIIS